MSCYFPYNTSFEEKILETFGILSDSVSNNIFSEPFEPEETFYYDRIYTDKYCINDNDTLQAVVLSSLHSRDPIQRSSCEIFFNSNDGNKPQNESNGNKSKESSKQTNEKIIQKTNLSEILPKKLGNNNYIPSYFTDYPPIKSFIKPFDVDGSFIRKYTSFERHRLIEIYKIKRIKRRTKRKNYVSRSITAKLRERNNGKFVKMSDEFRQKIRDYKKLNLHIHKKRE